MADIKKEIRLVATLDDSAFKRQIEALKKSMGKEFSFDGQSMAGIKDVFKDVAKDFSKELKDALKGISIGGGRGSAAGGARSGDDSIVQEARQKAKMYRDDIREKDRMFEREQRQKAQEYFKEQKGKEKLLIKEAQEGEKERKKDLDSSRGRFDELKRKRTEERIEKSRLDRSLTARTLRGLGLDEDSAREGARKMEGFIDKVPGGRGLQNRFGSAGLAAAGLGAAGMGITRAMDEATNMRRAVIHRQQAESLDIMRGRALEGGLRQSGRGFNATSAGYGVGGALAGAGAGAAIGSLAGPLGTVAGAAIGGIYGGVKGYFAGGESEAETRAQKGRPALEALEYARSMRQGRVQAMTGGGVTGNNLSLMQQRGAEQFGFAPEETIQHFNQARQFLGNKGAKGNLGTLQELQRQVGVEVPESARAAELFAGGGRTTMGEGVAQTVETLKKGVAAGLDASKSSQFLKATSDFVQQSAGLGQVDVGKIADELSRSTFGFARGGEATDMDVQRAMSLEQQKRQESTATSGLAAVGNVMAVQQAMPNASAGQFMAAQTISANAKPEDVMSILGVDKDTAEKFLKAKGQNLNTSLETVAGGDEALKTALGARATGQTSEQFFGRQQAEAFQGPMQAGQLPGVQKSAELDSLIKESSVKQAEFVSGIGLMARESAMVAEKLKKVAEDIGNAAKYIEDTIGPSNLSRTKR